MTDIIEQLKEEGFRVVDYGRALRGDDPQP